MRTNVTCALRICSAAATVLLIAGCSATHVGESWQCPLAQGTSCATIAEADPAVPASAARPAVLFGDPLPGTPYQIDGAAAGVPRDAGVACDSGCGPIAWLRTLFGANADRHATAQPTEAPVSAAAAEPVDGLDGEALVAAPDPASTTDASLRVPEVLGRIWIAPFVDADGIYREAHWVRVVLAPAAWKLP